MGKRETHVIHIPRWLTVILWFLLSAAMVLTIYFLSGHAYQREMSLARVMSIPAVLAALAPAIADALFFMPWGALAFLALDRAGQPRRLVYTGVMAVGVAFALGLVAWQVVLPTRVTGRMDVLWNALGCGAGAAIGHARRRFRFRFE